MEDTSAKADNMGKTLDLMGVVGAASWLLHVHFAVARVHVPEERFTSSDNGYSCQKIRIKLKFIYLGRSS